MGLGACSRDKNRFSSQPFLQLNWTTVLGNSRGTDSFIVANLYFTDGDGDLGLKDTDTTGVFGYGQPYFSNLKVWMWQKKNGTWAKLMDPFNLGDTLDLSERLPYMTPKGRNKWVEGSLDLKIPAEPYTLKPDTVKLELQLIDRSLKHSNRVFSDVMVLKH